MALGALLLKGTKATAGNMLGDVKDRCEVLGITCLMSIFRKDVPFICIALFAVQRFL